MVVAALNRVNSTMSRRNVIIAAKAALNRVILYTYEIAAKAHHEPEYDFSAMFYWVWDRVQVLVNGTIDSKFSNDH